MLVRGGLANAFIFRPKLKAIFHLHISTFPSDMEREDERRYLAASDEFYSTSDFGSQESQMALARCNTSKGFLSHFNPIQSDVE